MVDPATRKYSGPAQGLGMLIRLHKITSTYQVIRVYALSDINLTLNGEES
jgi:hypothetical protein